MGFHPRPIDFAKVDSNALYFLSVVLVRSLRWTGVTRYGTLWCPDFPPALSEERASDRSTNSPIGSLLDQNPNELQVLHGRGFLRLRQ